MGGTGDQDVGAAGDGGVEEAGGRRGEAALGDETCEVARALDEFADVDRRRGARDVGEDDVEAGSVGEHRVDEGLGEIDAPARGAQHPLDEVVEFARGQLRRRQLVGAVDGDEDLAGGIYTLDISQLGNRSVSWSARQRYTSGSVRTRRTRAWA